MVLMPDESEEETQDKLPQDNETPFRPADPVAGGSNDPLQRGTQQLDDTHPATDSNIQPEEEYDEGVSGAAEAAEPDNSVQ
jgi:hypothetical protein